MMKTTSRLVLLTLACLGCAAEPSSEPLSVAPLKTVAPLETGDNPAASASAEELLISPPDLSRLEQPERVDYGVAWKTSGRVEGVKSRLISHACGSSERVEAAGVIDTILEDVPPVKANPAELPAIDSSGTEARTEE